MGGREGNVTAFLTSHVAVIREWFREKHRVNHEGSGWGHRGRGGTGEKAAAGGTPGIEDVNAARTQPIWVSFSKNQ